MEVLGIGETAVFGEGNDNGFCSVDLGNSKAVGDIEFKLTSEGGFDEGNGTERSIIDNSDGLVESAFSLK